MSLNVVRIESARLSYNNAARLALKDEYVCFALF